MPSVVSSTVTNQMSTTAAATKKVTKKTAPVAEVVVAAAAAAPVAEEKKARGRKPAAKTELTVPVVAGAAATSAPAVELTEAAPATFESVISRLRDVQVRVASELKELVREAQLAAKAAAREVKDARKKRRVKKDVADMTAEEKTAYEARRANNAFLKPRALTPELCAFMGLPAGSQRSQTDVTRFVSQYVKSHSCFDPANKRRIISDGALSKLLKVTDKDTVTYLNLQSYLKAHFVKA